MMLTDSQRFYFSGQEFYFMLPILRLAVSFIQNNDDANVGLRSYDGWWVQIC